MVPIQPSLPNLPPVSVAAIPPGLVQDPADGGACDCGNPRVAMRKAVRRSGFVLLSLSFVQFWIGGGTSTSNFLDCLIWFSSLS